MSYNNADALRVGVVGAGRIGRLHAEILASQIPGATLTAVADVRPELAEEIASSLGVPSMLPSALIASSDVDAVAICSSTDSHVDLILEASAAGKAIFCEKPISLDLAQVDKALGAVEGAGVAFMIGFNRRFDAAHEAVRNAVVSGDVGEVQLARITSRDPAPPPLSYAKVSGGIFLDMTIHDFDMARFVTGSEVVEVYAQGAVRIDPALAEIGDVDTAVINLVHENGCFTVIDNSRQAVYGYDQRVEVFGSKGLAASDNPLATTSTVRTAEGTRQPALPYFFLERYHFSYINEWRAFVEAMAQGAAPPVGAADARAPLVIGLAAGLSLREHRPVSVAEVDLKRR